MCSEVGVFRLALGANVTVMGLNRGVEGGGVADG